MTPGSGRRTFTGHICAIYSRGSSLKGATTIPFGVRSMDAAKGVGIEAPKPIQARWQTMDPAMQVNKLFSVGHRTLCRQSTGRSGDEISSRVVQARPSTVSFRVPVKTDKILVPNMGLGLVELFTQLKIKGRSMRATTKGLMFFLTCTRPQNIVWSALQAADKRHQAPTFSLAWQKRLVGIINDPRPKYGTNHETHEEVVHSRPGCQVRRQRSRSLLGPTFKNFQWCKLLHPCKNFANHVTILDKESVYTTINLVSVGTFLYRNGDYLKTQWPKLRGAYSLFRSTYDRSLGQERCHEVV